MIHSTLLLSHKYIRYVLKTSILYDSFLPSSSVISTYVMYLKLPNSMIHSTLLLCHKYIGTYVCT